MLMQEVKCYVCDGFVIKAEKIVLPKGELPFEIKHHIQYRKHIVRREIKTKATEVLKAIQDVTPELDSPSSLQVWQRDLTN